MLHVHNDDIHVSFRQTRFHKLFAHVIERFFKIHLKFGQSRENSNGPAQGGEYTCGIPTENAGPRLRDPVVIRVRVVL